MHKIVGFRAILGLQIRKKAVKAALKSCHRIHTEECLAKVEKHLAFEEVGSL